MRKSLGWDSGKSNLRTEPLELAAEKRHAAAGAKRRALTRTACAGHPKCEARCRRLFFCRKGKGAVRTAYCEVIATVNEPFASALSCYQMLQYVGPRGIIAVTLQPLQLLRDAAAVLTNIGGACR